MASVSPEISIRSRDWQRKYPPLMVALAAVVAVIFLLPSALNLPQTNPTRTLEYAPVPPSDENANPPNGNLSSLGLASTAGLEQGGAPGGDNGGLLPDNPLNDPSKFRPPGTKRCSEGRQTEDPLAPPCVAFFSGDNYGATYQGVTRTDVRVLMYVSGNLNYLRGSEGSEVTPDHQYFDLGQDPKGHEHVLVRAFRAFQAYFNNRYQTYDRFVHFYVYFSSGDQSAEAKRGEAVDNYNKVQPFAVMLFAPENADSYLQVMADHHVLNFGSFVGHDQSFFQQFPKLIWGYQPSLQTEARSYVSYLCKKVVPQPSTRAGGNLANSKRTFGLVYYKPLPGYPNKHPELQTFDSLVEQQLKQQCGVTIPERFRFSFPDSGYAADTQFAPDYAVQAMTAFKSSNITTILWPGGYETNFSKEANTLSYQPEWIVLGDGVSDADAGGLFQDQTTWTDHAWVVTSQPLQPAQRNSLCYAALKEADPEYPDADASFSCADFHYELLRQLFTGIQVAGPRLGPTSIDKGYHAIPAVNSTSPLVPACYYEPNDYTCIKDGAAEYWDGQRTAPSYSQPGCWVMVEAGKRYLSGQWPDGNIDTNYKPGNQTENVCNNYGGTYLINNSPPASHN